MSLRRRSRTIGKDTRRVLAMKRRKASRRTPKTLRPLGPEWHFVLDYLWAECVKLRADWKCEVTGVRPSNGSMGLHAHHVLKKADRLLRYHRDSGVCLAAFMHGKYEFYSNHDEQTEIIAKFPRDIEKLKADHADYLAGRVRKEDYPEIFIRLVAWRSEYTNQDLLKPSYIPDGAWVRVKLFMERYMDENENDLLA